MLAARDLGIAILHALLIPGSTAEKYIGKRLRFESVNGIIKTCCVTVIKLSYILCLHSTTCATCGIEIALGVIRT